MKLIDFLKKYSTLSDIFIDDFYNIYDYNESNNNDFYNKFRDNISMARK